MVIAALAIGVSLVFAAALVGWAWLPGGICAAGECNEAREWIATLIALVIVLGGLYEYVQAQNWKRAEWIAAETASFFADQKVMNALRMLDWHARILPVLDDCQPAETTFRFRSEMLSTALYSISTIPKDPATGNPRKYLTHELAIRDCFDRLLDRLERFQIFVESDLVSTRELEPYLEYWITLIGDAENNPYKTPDIIHRLWVYIDEYKFTRVQTLCLEFGYDIKPSSSLKKPDAMLHATDLKVAIESPELPEDAGG
jgi:hypothetical protein